MIIPVNNKSVTLVLWLIILIVNRVIYTYLPPHHNPSDGASMEGVAIRTAALEIRLADLQRENSSRADFFNRMSELEGRLMELEMKTKADHAGGRPPPKVVAGRSRPARHTD